MGHSLKQTSFQSRHANGQWAQEKMLNIRGLQEMRTKTTAGHPLHIHENAAAVQPVVSIRMVTIKKTDNPSTRTAEKLELSHIVGRNVIWCSHFGKQFGRSSKSWTELPTVWPSNSTPRCTLKRTENTSTQKHVHQCSQQHYSQELKRGNKCPSTG